MTLEMTLLSRDLVRVSTLRDMTRSMTAPLVSQKKHHLTDGYL